MSEPTTERPVNHLMIPLLDDSTGCCGVKVSDLPTDGSHLLTRGPMMKTCDGHGRVREQGERVMIGGQVATVTDRSIEWDD